ncbi:glutamyl-tRNA reductase [Nocardioides marmoribigeumensis]|uniref:Glutamyl-tRNA reductase n=1 Tax=Nocardioides marmoribigeumensis TaxID=433649 RepID=A0ABU2BSV9_9ACTN|nr:glutamyl-tRNA reductase [Nocardioides marmoribigeumensis]MDR7361715.1 glutamyl-tRNA reductase [Nocardioides marmoribigeumensis]
MSILVVGVSHHSAPVELLERLALDGDQVEKLVQAVQTVDHVRESTVLATCNRVEIYTEVDRFHGSVEAICQALCDLSGEATDEVVPHLYVHYDDGAVSHLFHVAAGLDSMVVGEGQILSQARESLRLGQELGTVGPALNAAFQQALRVAKRTHTETDIDHAAPSLVSVSLDRAGEWLGGLEGRRAVVVGAGSMAGLAVATLIRAGVRDVVVLNRTEDKGARLAAAHGARSAPVSALAAEVAQADLLLSCTGAVGTVIDASVLEQAWRASDGVRRAVVDLALPHDVDPAVGDLPGVRLIGLRRLAEELGDDTEAGAGMVDVIGVRRIVSEEIRAFLDARRVASVTPTVVALRSMATDVVDAELTRLDGRLSGLDPVVRTEVEQALRRVAQKLLHQPTVRVKELASRAGVVSYAEALAELFALDPQAVEAVTSAEAARAAETDPEGGLS